jgi:Domain of unknown function (DUF5658)
VDPLSKSLLLFVMNWLDAQLTILWVRLNIATEANGLMARLLNHSETSFLLVKLSVGAFAACVLYRCAHLPIAKRGMRLVLCIYIAVMLVHAAIGCYALGWETPAVVFGHFGSLPNALMSLFS